MQELINKSSNICYTNQPIKTLSGTHQITNNNTFIIQGNKYLILNSVYGLILRMIGPEKKHISKLFKKADNFYFLDYQGINYSLERIAESIIIQEQGFKK